MALYGLLWLGFGLDLIGFRLDLDLVWVAFSSYLDSRMHKNLPFCNLHCLHFLDVLAILIRYETGFGRVPGWVEFLRWRNICECRILEGETDTQIDAQAVDRGDYVFERCLKLV